MLLSIDTSAGTSIALIERDGTLVAEVSTPETMRHAEAIGEFFAELDVSHRPIEAVVVGVGPGPFTGLRVGIAAARTFAWAAQIELWPIVSHDAAAFALSESGFTGSLFVETDARRREFFVTEYEVSAPGVIRRIHEPHIRPEKSGELTHEISAAALARAALARIAQGVGLDSPAAIYLRHPDVTLSAPKRVSS